MRFDAAMNTIAALPESGLIALDKWTQSIGRTPATVWRWRKRGWLPTVNIAGKNYVTNQASADFRARAERGEFALDVRPNREQAKN